MQPIDHFPGTDHRKDRISCQRANQPHLHSGAATDRLETTNLIFPPIPEVVGQQHQETHLNDNHRNSTIKNNNSTHTPKFKRRNDVESQALPIRETSPQVSGSSTEPFPKNQTRSTPAQCLKDSKQPELEFQRNETDMTANESGDDNITPPKTTTSQIEERLVRHQITNELYIPLSSKIVLKRKKRDAAFLSGIKN